MTSVSIIRDESSGKEEWHTFCPDCGFKYAVFELGKAPSYLVQSHTCPVSHRIVQE